MRADGARCNNHPAAFPAAAFQPRNFSCTMASRSIARREELRDLVVRLFEHLFLRQKDDAHVACARLLSKAAAGFKAAAAVCMF